MDWEQFFALFVTIFYAASLAYVLFCMEEDR